jgi:lysyl-tRNA synthetase class I
MKDHMIDRNIRIASTFNLAIVAMRVAGLDETRVAILRKHYRKEKDRSEWALLDSQGEKVLRWFGLQKPSEARVKKEEQRIQFFKHQNGSIL